MRPSRGIAARTARDINMSSMSDGRIIMTTGHEENPSSCRVNVISTNGDMGLVVSSDDDGNQQQHERLRNWVPSIAAAASPSPSKAKGLDKESAIKRQKMRREEKPGGRNSRDCTDRTDKQTAEQKQAWEEQEDHVVDQQKQAIQDLAVALSEAQRELRDAKDESDVLRQTCRALSDSLRQSESERQGLQLEVESLHLQLSSVCYVDLNHHRRQSALSPSSCSLPTLSSPDRQRRRCQPTSPGNDTNGTDDTSKRPFLPRGNSNLYKNDATPDPNFSGRRKKSRRIGAGQQVQPPRHSMRSKDEEESAIPHGSTRADGEIVCREIDGTASCYEFTAEDVDVTVAPRSLIHSANAQAFDAFIPARPTAAVDAASTPSQAAFYRVLAERDHARQDADRLRKEVKARREQVRSLRGQLLKSTALIELSYQRSKGGENNDEKIENGQDADASDCDTDGDGVENEDVVPGVERLSNAGAALASARTRPLRKIKWLRQNRRRRRKAKLQPPPALVLRKGVPPTEPAAAPFLPDREQWDSNMPRLPSKSAASMGHALTELRRDDSAGSRRIATGSNLVASSSRALPEEDRYYVEPFRDPSRGVVRSFSLPSLSFSPSSSSITPASDADRAAGGTRLHTPSSPHHHRHRSQQRPSALKSSAERNCFSGLLSPLPGSSASIDEEGLQGLVPLGNGGNLVEL